MNARIIIGSNYGDEGKGTVVATYTKQLSNVLNVLTNGGAQRGHSILLRTEV
jgi:adenylosuccinate synthase